MNDLIKLKRILALLQDMEMENVPGAMLPPDLHEYLSVVEDDIARFLEPYEEELWWVKKLKMLII